MTQEQTQAPSAASSGASATERFRSDKKAGASADPERVDLLAREVIGAVHDTIRRHKVTYDEYNALKSWLISVGEDGEWPLFLDVWIEHVVEEVATEHREGNKGTIEGPYYVPDSPDQGARGSLPMRDGETGTPLVWTGKVTSTDGSPLAGAKVEVWHADNDGLYSQFAPDIPEWNLRASFTTDENGDFEITTIRPAPYQIPTDGSAASSSPPPAGTRGAPRTSTSRPPPPGTSCSPRSCTSPATSTTTTTSPRRSSPS